MKLVVDGVFFQLADTGIARVWTSILPRLASHSGLSIVLLNRGNCPSFNGIESLEFPSYNSANAAADSYLLDRLCKELAADVFTSTYYTTPMTIPSVLLVYDMIPELFEFKMHRNWQEKQLAISFASYYACISENTRTDLKRFYPAIDNDRAIVAHCGVERSVFRPRDKMEIVEFKRRFEISKAFYLLVGSRHQTREYKNASLLFDALRQNKNYDFEILCAGGEPDIQDKVPGLPIRQVNLSDRELSCAYSGAEALIFPSLYEGFGMPVVEAMACGCPVITTKLGPLEEVAGDAATFISGRDQDELHRAMAMVREPSYRKRMIERGLAQAGRYSWDVMAQTVYELLQNAHNERDTPSAKRFFRDWERLRTLQGAVDTNY